MFGWGYFVVDKGGVETVVRGMVKREPGVGKPEESVLMRGSTNRVRLGPDLCPRAQRYVVSQLWKVLL